MQQGNIMAMCNRMFVFYALFLIFKPVSTFEYLALDKDLTRREIITPLGQPVNLGCYVNKNTNSSQTPSTPAPTSLVYSWKKGNDTVTQSSRARIHRNVLVVTPIRNEDYGTYECSVTNGVSNARCEITLKRGWREKSAGNKKKSNTGCVNVSVLMPVLAVAVISCLLFVHLVVKRKEPKILAQRRRKSTASIAHPHDEQRKMSRNLLYNSFDHETFNNNEKKDEVVSIEMHEGNGLTSTPSPPEDNPTEDRRIVRKSGFYSKSFRQLSMDTEDAEVTSQTSEESKTSNGKSGFYNKTFKNSSFDVADGEDDPRASVHSTLNRSKGGDDNAFYNKTYKNDSIDESDGEVFAHPLEETVGIDAPKRGKGKGFINKNYHSESMDLDDGDVEAPAKDESIVDAIVGVKGKGFLNEGFKTDSVDVPGDIVKVQTAADDIVKAQTAADDIVKAQTAADDIVKAQTAEEPNNETEHRPSMDTYF